MDMFIFVCFISLLMKKKNNTVSTIYGFSNAMETGNKLEVTPDLTEKIAKQMTLCLYMHMDHWENKDICKYFFSAWHIVDK